MDNMESIVNIVKMVEHSHRNMSFGERIAEAERLLGRSIAQKKAGKHPAWCEKSHY